MPVEIERKFVITNINTALLQHGKLTRQGYLCISPEVRVRVMDGDAYLTIKGEGAVARPEYEYRIPLSEAEELLEMCNARINKTRYVVGGFEVDVYHGKLDGLITAEAPLSSAHQEVTLPVGLGGVDVTNDPRFKNRNLAQLESAPRLQVSQ